MPRRSRLIFDDTPVHVIQRGNNRADCFFSESDYQLYLTLLIKACGDEEVLLHAYVLMTNHVHLLMTPTDGAGVSRVMKSVGGPYVQSVNRRHGRSGTLWEGRFRSCLVDEEKYLLNCYRYVELNPVRAQMVDDPGGYPWSSYRANALGEGMAGLTPHGLYQALGVDRASRQAAYQALFRSGLDGSTLNEIRGSTNGGFVLGREHFQRRMAAALGRRTWRERPGRPPARSGAESVVDQVAAGLP